MFEMERALEAALKPQTEVDVRKIMKEMKNNALAASTLDQLVMSGPVAVQCLGACSMAAFSANVEAIRVPMLPGAKVERPPYLAYSLTSCSNLGTVALLAVNKGMATVVTRTTESQRRITEVMKSLFGEELHEVSGLLPNVLTQIQNQANECYSATREMDQSIAKWLELTLELLEACQNKSGVAADERQKNVTQKASTAGNVMDANQMAASTKDAMNNLNKIIDSTRATFKKAAESQPNGWDLVAQHSISSLGQCLTTGISLAVPAFVDSLDANARAGTTGALLRDFQDDAKAAAVRTAAPSTPPPVVDQALAYIQKDLYLFDLLRTIIKGVDGNMDWQASNASDPKSGVNFIGSLLSQSKLELDKQTSNGFVTTAYKQILTDVTQIISEIQKASKDASTGAALPRKGSDMVVKWEKSFDIAYRSVNALCMRAKSLPYVAALSSPAIPYDRLPVPQIDVKASQTRAVLEHAAARFEMAVKSMGISSSVYGETQKLRLEQEQQLADLHATMVQRTSGEIKLEEVKGILLACITPMVELKVKIVRMALHFGALAAAIKTINENLLANWLITFKNAVDSGIKAMPKIGQYSQETTERTLLLNGLVSIASQLAVLADAANIWRSLAERSVLPGIQIAGQLNQPYDSQRTMAQLIRWSREAFEGIKGSFAERCQQVQSSISDYEGEVRAGKRDLPGDAATPMIVEVAEKIAGQIESAQKAALRAEVEDSAVRTFIRK